MKILWFKAKIYGWGWYPATWQGWIILLIWIVLFTYTLRITDSTYNSIENIFLEKIIPVILLVILLIFICYGTGEKPRWRWGK